MIAECACRHAYQDQKYGSGWRVHNRVKPKGKEVVARCTVCDTEKSGAGLRLKMRGTPAGQ